MSRGSKRLTARTVASLSKSGFHADGNGLYLQVSKTGTKSWVFRYQLNKKPRWMGLGPIEFVSLQEAREKAFEAKKLVHDGIDPINLRKADRQSTAGTITFEEAAGRYIAAHKDGWKNDKHKAQWASTLKTYSYPHLGDLPIGTIETGHVLNVLEPIWKTKTETATRVRGRIELVLDWAAARGYRSGENPARWKGHLNNLLPAPSKLKKVKHHNALSYDELPALAQELRLRDGVGARALEFLILTAARTGEVREAVWSEIDLNECLWDIPAERMKAGKNHKIPLCSRAINILQALMQEHGNEGYIFPGLKPNKPMSNMSFTAVLKRMGYGHITTHGFRSTFRDWVAEKTNYPNEVAEMALAHTISNKAEAAYRRGDLMDKRRAMMNEWAQYNDNN